MAGLSVHSLIIWVGGSFGISFAVFWGLNLLLFLIDSGNGPISNWFRRYKIQENKNAPLMYSKYMSAVKVVVFNQTVVGIPVMLFLYPLGQWRDITLDTPFPVSPLLFIRHLVICSLVEEAGFYYLHRLMHHPTLYKRFHHIHHEWTAPVGIIGIYNHPLEHVLTNLLPAFAAVFIAGTGLSFAWFFWCCGLTMTSITHSGYHLPFLPSAESHDYHHSHFTNCFGIFGILDWIHGTDRRFRNTIRYQRHRTLLSLTPAKLLYPDSKSVKNGQEENTTKME